MPLRVVADVETNTHISYFLTLQEALEMNMHTSLSIFRRGIALVVALWLSFSSPMMAFAQDAIDAGGDPTGAPVDTGAPSNTGTQSCTGAGCNQGVDQGVDQGANQGVDQGGSSLEDLGAVQTEEGDWVLPYGVDDTRQGADQGTAQGAVNGVSATTSDTGADSTNTTSTVTDSTARTSINNSAIDTTAAQLTGTTGGNTQNRNTQADGITTGNAGIGVTQVKNDTTATIGGSAGLTTSGYNGDYFGDLVLSFGLGTANLSGAGGEGTSVRAINDTTGSDSHNAIDVATRTEELNEVQNDGRIENLLDLLAITGQNEASMNTSGGFIQTGDADIAATLVNLLNTTVINGNLWVTVADIFGDLVGNVYLPDFARFLPVVNSQLAVEASNDTTGEDSQNTIDVDVTDTETTDIANDAAVSTTVNAEAITGQNEAEKNTGGGEVTTGDGSVSASNITVANTTVEGGNWGLVIVNALNRWLGFLVSDTGGVRALSQEETIRGIEAHNTHTGSDSTNEITVDLERERATSVGNLAVIDNRVTAAAITGQNTANKNTGAAYIETGDANVEVTAVNIANTTVKDGSLFIAVVNIFGDWFGDLLYDGTSLLATAGGGEHIAVDGVNETTGAHSANELDVNIDRSHETTIDNEADIQTTLNATIDTGNNRANRNTLGGKIDTGYGQVALHSRTAANLVALALDGGNILEISGLNDTTGAESKNRISAHINDERIITVNNDANVSTVLPGWVNTGNNEASFNTLGGSIVTGDAAANIGIYNIINRVLLALRDPDADWGVEQSGAVHGAGSGAGFALGDEVIVDFLNRLTGAFSDNSNDVSYDRDLLIDILNDGVVDNLVDLLLNTGGNKANENTGGGSVASGQGCVDGLLNTVVNSGSGIVGGASLTLDNDADVSNISMFDVATGYNEVNDNTGMIVSSREHVDGPCPYLALAPQPPSAQQLPPAVGGSQEGAEEEEEAEAVAADEEEEGDVHGAFVAGAVIEEQPPILSGPREVLTRFPVAGVEGTARLVPATSRPVSLWLLLTVGGSLLLALTWHFDQRARSSVIITSL